MSGLPSGGRLQYRHKACLLFQISPGSNRHMKEEIGHGGCVGDWLYRRDLANRASNKLSSGVLKIFRSGTKCSVTKVEKQHYHTHYRSPSH